MKWKEWLMRSVLLFVSGILVALGVQALIAQSPNRGIVGLNHVGISVPNLDQAVTYYTKTMGFPEAFRNLDDKGKPTLVYVQISKNTFLELLPAGPDRPAGLNHFGVVVDKMTDATAMFKQRGANVAEIRLSGTKAILSNVTDPNGVRMELLELPPESSHRQAMDRWK
jgi:catechol 2,3-dioxygenase-like lactoylglutathione lyase family enzyme